MSKKTDILYQTVDHINDLNNRITTVIPTISSVSQELHKVTTSLDLVDKLMKEVHTLEQSIATLKTICKGLSFIPIIGTVCSEISTICESVKSILSGLDHPIQEIRKTLEKINTAIQKINHQVENIYQKLSLAHTKIPAYTSSFDLLIALFEIADIVELDQAVLQELNQMETEITQLGHFIQTYKDRLTTIEQQFKTEIQKVLNTVQSIRTIFGPFIIVFNDIGKVINPIAKGLDTVCNVIKPLKWVLNAFSWLFNKILKPAIQKVLQVTGLQKLIDSFEHAITKLLHLDQLKAEIDQVATDVMKPLNDLEQKMNDLFGPPLEQLYTQLDQTLSSEGQTKVMVKMVDYYLDYLTNDDTPFKPIKFKTPDWPFTPLPLPTTEDCTPTYLPLMRKNRSLHPQNVPHLSSENEVIQHPKLQRLNQLSSTHELNLTKIKGEIQIISTFRQEKELLNSLLETTLTYLKLIHQRITHAETEKLLLILEHGLTRANDSLKDLDQHFITIEQVIQDFSDYHLKVAHASPSTEHLMTVDQAFTNLVELKSYPQQLKHSIDSQLMIADHSDTFTIEVENLENAFNDSLDEVLELMKDHCEKSKNLTLKVERLNQHNGLFHEKIWEHASVLHNVTVKLQALSHPISVILDSLNSTAFQHYGEELAVMRDWVSQHLSIIPINNVEKITEELLNLLLPDSFSEKLEDVTHAVTNLKIDTADEKVGLLLSKQLETMQKSIDELEHNPYITTMNQCIASSPASLIELNDILEESHQYESQFSQDKYQFERYILLFETLIQAKESIENEYVKNYLSTSQHYWESCLKTHERYSDWQTAVTPYENKIQSSTLSTLTKYNEDLQHLFQICYPVTA